MKIGILGAGTVGRSLARAVLPLGHTIMLSSRSPHSDEMLQLARELGSPVSTVAETIAFGDLIALALRWDAVPDAVAQGDWDGKILVDMTNRFGGGSGQSAAQDLARLAPGAQVVKAFNTLGAEHYTHPVFGGQAATLLIAGDSPDAKHVVRQLAEAMGFDVADAGDLAASSHLEALAALWVHLAMRAGYGRQIAFRLLRG